MQSARLKRADAARHLLEARDFSRVRLHYETIDENQVKVIISYNDVSGTGIITVNEEGAITQFYSDDRQVEEIDGVETRIGWKCEYEDYRVENGILRAHTVRSIKVYPDRELNYFDADDFTVEYTK